MRAATVLHRFGTLPNETAAGATTRSPVDPRPCPLVYGAHYTHATSKLWTVECKRHLVNRRLLADSARVETARKAAGSLQGSDKIVQLQQPGATMEDCC
jgi:hypothetical protein